MTTLTLQSFGMNYVHPNDVKIKILPGYQRIIDDAVISGGSQLSPHWNNIETARGVYDWSQLDLIVAAGLARGQKLIYTFCYVPAWSNGNNTKDVPPTNFQDYYDFCTAVATRYKGKISVYEVWNEANNSGSSGYWSGTVAQMVTLSNGGQAALKAADPNCQVTSPSVAPIGGHTYLQQYFAAGGSPFDGIAVHFYWFTSLTDNRTPASILPEQNWMFLKYIIAAKNAAGYASSPIVCPEGGWLNSSAVPVLDKQAAWASIWQAILLTNGVQYVCWYAYENGTFGDLTTDATQLLVGANSPALNAAGVAFKETMKWLLGATVVSPVARNAGTNGVRNPTFSGGGAGTVPTNFILYNPDSGNGITAAINGVGTEGGLTYLEVHVSGTATTGAAGYVELFFESGTQIAATVGQWFTTGARVKIQSGSTANLTGPLVLGLNEYNSGGTYVGNSLYFGFTPQASSLPDNDVQFPAQVLTSGAAFVDPFIAWTYAVGAVIDITVRIALPFCDSSTIWLGTITKPGGYSGLIMWDASGGPTLYSPPSPYNVWTRDIYGTGQPIPPNGVLLTNQPVIMESAQWSGSFL